MRNAYYKNLAEIMTYNLLMNAGCIGKAQENKIVDRWKMVGKAMPYSQETCF